MELSIIKEKHNYKSIIRVIFALLIISTLITYIFVGNDLFGSFKKYLDGILYGFIVGLTFWAGNWLIGCFTGSKLNWKSNPNRANTISLLMFFGYGILASMSVPYFYRWYFYGQRSSLNTEIIMHGFINLSVDLLFVSLYYSKYLVRYYVQSLVNEEELKQENLKARYEALKNQVNPHFLFNSLNTLSGVVEQNPEKAVDFIKKLSDIYRYVLDQRDKEVVRVEDEMMFIENYMHLAKVRHGEGLSLIIDNKLKNIFVAPLGLQILIENAIKHNVISDDQPLKIEIFIDDGYIVVRNNKQKKSTSIENTSVGLENLKNRYSFFSSVPVVVIEDEKYFIVKLPLIEKPVQ